MKTIAPVEKIKKAQRLLASVDADPKTREILDRVDLELDEAISRLLGIREGA